MADIMETVAELRRMEAEATPGKWCYDDGITDDDTGERGKCRAIERYGGKPSESLIAILDVDSAYARRIDVDGRLIVAMRNNLSALLDYIERMQSAVIAEVGKDFGHATGQHEGALHKIMFPMHDRTNAGLLVASINRLRDALRDERKEAIHNG